MHPPDAVHLLLLAKAPRPGRAKTRLTPPRTPYQAADVARAALLDTLDVLRAVPAARRTVVLDGDAAGLLPPDCHVLPQRSGDLGARLAGAFADAHAACPAPLRLVGMDTPQLTPALVGDAVRALHVPGTGAVLGPAEDGGWWALGLHRPLTGAFDGVPMSTGHTGAAQRARLETLGLRTALLPALRDIDLASDLPLVRPALAARTRLTVLLDRLLDRLEPVA